jgi:2-polyprenyl-6-methoxyphenol hydroxylase-like FAD-dependent oxidoreductase
MKTRRVDVVVVGAGPTGLLLAGDLLLNGVGVVVVERRTEPDQTPKAGGLGVLAGEVLERRGLGAALDAEEAAALEAMKTTRTPLAAAAGGSARPAGPSPVKFGKFADLNLIDPKLQREPGRRMRGVNQQALDRILTEHANKLGVEVLRGFTVEGIEEKDESVTLAARGPEGALSLDAAFAVGCDGARSVVRKGSGFDFPGTEPTLTGRQGIVEIDHPERLPPAGWTRTTTGVMSWGLEPGRLSVIEFGGAPANRDAPVSKEELEESLRRVSGADVRITALRSAARWTDHSRQVTSYRKGRVLLAGDAAHIHSPFGGQGLNLGLVDASNLGWKLAATLRGSASDGLLDTYDSERRPVGARVLDNTRAQLALMRPDPQTTALRKIIIHLLTTNADANRTFGEMISGVDTRYDLGDEEPLVGTLLGNRDLTIDDAKTRLYSLMHDGRGLLVDGDGQSGAAADRIARVRVVKVPGARSMLIRPDGCLAWAGKAGTLGHALRRWF